MKQVNESGTLETDDDIAARRIKNRDRQRRYRARKRLEADSKKANHHDQVHDNLTTRKCTRDWKTEARMAHGVIGDREHAMMSCLSGNSLNLDDGERIVANGGRNWKEEARRSFMNEGEF
ncbi:uncharacterized protein LOC124942940 [Impatiens glandulifera]|uniref:uncharacterized protein LOC124942940 n=1 Tax=Impatiens glandulifera TaxID=253017 RepID=UPI001FB0CE54|nr:uncharacterized protein LOC124942940 [Impatiens glandulifera]